jgi:abortive infection bacteriophage resistance protein
VFYAPIIKKWLNFDEQIDRISERGFSDVKKYRSYVENVGYYRLSGYCYPFREMASNGKTRLSTFYPDSSFADVVSIYEFDRKLREVLFSAIGKIEIAFRVKVAYTLGEISPTAHLQPKLLDKSCRENGEYDRFMDKYNNIVEKSQKKYSFVSHHNNKYGGELPVWAAVNLMPFGCIIRLYHFVPIVKRKELAKKFFDLRADELSFWIFSIGEIRNACAHHSRLWNYLMSIRPKFIEKGKNNRLPLSYNNKSRYKIYNTVLYIVYILNRLGEHESIQEIKNHLLDFPRINHLNIHKDMGFPDGWDKHEIWNAGVL